MGMASLESSVASLAVPDGKKREMEHCDNPLQNVPTRVTSLDDFGRWREDDLGCTSRDEGAKAEYDDNTVSRLTVLMYLNDDFDGRPRM